MKQGRPTKFNQKIADEICDRIAEGETLRKICQDEHLPFRSTIHRWLLNSDMKDFCDQYTLARQIQAHGFVEEIFEIADEKEGDYAADEFGNLKPNHEYINRSRLRIDTRKWFASKVMPKIYGDKIELSGDKEAPLHVHTVQELKHLTDDQLLEQINALTKGE